jgi:predicted RNase H-like HicB family nuclease
MKKTARYFGLLDGEAGAYGIAFPDAPGCAAMGATEDLAIVNAIAALAEWIAYSDKNGFERPEARNAVDFRRDAEVIEAVRGGGRSSFPFRCWCKLARWCAPISLSMPVYSMQLTVRRFGPG